MCYALYVRRSFEAKFVVIPGLPAVPMGPPLEVRNYITIRIFHVTGRWLFKNHQPSITVTQTPHTLTGYARCGGQVITPLVTSTSTGMNNTVEGKQFDEEGDGFLVGVAIVQPTGDPLIDLILSLPSDAVTQMPVHLSISCMGWRQIRLALCPAANTTHTPWRRNSSRSSPLHPRSRRRAVSEEQRAAVDALITRAREQAAASSTPQS